MLICRKGIIAGFDGIGEGKENYYDNSFDISISINKDRHTVKQIVDSIKKKSVFIFLQNRFINKKDK